jgi:hypothetical protein
VAHQAPEHVGVVKVHRPIAGRKDREPEHENDRAQQPQQKDPIENLIPDLVLGLI